MRLSYQLDTVSPWCLSTRPYQQRPLINKTLVGSGMWCDKFNSTSNVLVCETQRKVNMYGCVSEWVGEGSHASQSVQVPHDWRTSSEGLWHIKDACAICVVPKFPFDRGQVKIHGCGTHTQEQASADDTGNSLDMFPVPRQVCLIGVSSERLIMHEFMNDRTRMLVGYLSPSICFSTSVSPTDR